MARPIPAEGEALLGKQAKYKRGLKARSIIRSTAAGRQNAGKPLQYYTAQPPEGRASRPRHAATRCDRRAARRALQRQPRPFRHLSVFVGNSPNVVQTFLSARNCAGRQECLPHTATLHIKTSRSLRIADEDADTNHKSKIANLKSQVSNPAAPLTTHACRRSASRRNPGRVYRQTPCAGACRKSWTCGGKENPGRTCGASRAWPRVPPSTPPK